LYRKVTAAKQPINKPLINPVKTRFKEFLNSSILLFIL
jgi:hypothetical protein